MGLRLRDIFALAGKKPPVSINLGDLITYLELDHPRFVADADEHLPVIDAMGEYALRGGNHHGPSKSYYTDRKKTIFLQERAPEIVGHPDEIGKKPPLREFRASANIAYTETTLAFGRRGLALTIHRDVNEPRELYMYRTMVFGLYGVYDREGNLTIKKLKTPNMDSANRMTKLEDVPIDTANVKGALYFARLCAEQLYNGEGFSERQCLQKALNIDVENFSTPYALTLKL